MSTNAVVVALCALSLGATCYLIASQGGKGGGDEVVAELERKLDAAEKRADRIEALHADVRELKERLDRRGADLDRRVLAAQRPAGVSSARSDGRAEESARDGASPAGSAEGEVANSLEERIAASVEKRVSQKIESLGRDRERGEDGKWKAPLDELATELKLTEAQKAEAKRIFDHSRDETFTLLKTQRLDGGSILDDFAAALKSGADPTEATKQLFSRIFTEKVPGSDQTYLVEFMAMEKDIEDQLGRQIDAGQMKRLKSLRIDFLDVKTDYDPVGDYVRAKLQ